VKLMLIVFIFSVLLVAEAQGNIPEEDRQRARHG
jgi:hypothetical protein